MIDAHINNFLFHFSFRRGSHMNHLVVIRRPTDPDSLLRRHKLSDAYPNSGEYPEAQLLTTGTEQNLLKLGELRGTLTAEDESSAQ